MAKKKLGIGTVEINKRFKDQNEARKYAKRLNQYIRSICEKKNWQASAMIVIGNLKKEVSLLRYYNNGKRGRPKKELCINERIAYKWYKGDYKTDWHIHILLVSKPSYAFRNAIKKYIDKNWLEVPNRYEKKPFDINKIGGKKVYKKYCNIGMADYFINQSVEVRFCNCNYSEEEDLKYSLKEYYREYLKLDSGIRRFYAKLVKNWIPEDKQLKELKKIKSKFNMIEKYFYDITEDKNKKEVANYMKKMQLNKIAENYDNKENINKVQNISRKVIEDNSLF